MYALAWKKTCSHANFKSSTAMVIELYHLMLLHEEAEDDVKIMFTCISYLM